MTVLHRTHTATVERATRIADGFGGWPRQWAEIGDVVGSLQPSTPTEGEIGGTERVKARWMFYVDPDADIERDDRLTFAGVDVFSVTAVTRWTEGTLAHAVVMLEQIQEGT